MPFKIVQTIENSKICLAVVPSGWEEGGTLYWPNKSKLTTYKMQKQENCLPVKSEWEKSKCIKKRELPTFEEAEQECSLMEDNSDTEDFETGSFKRKRTSCGVSAERDFNYLMDMNNDLPKIQDSNKQEVSKAPQIPHEVDEQHEIYEKNKNLSKRVIILEDKTIIKPSENSAVHLLTDAIEPPNFTRQMPIGQVEEQQEPIYVFENSNFDNSEKLKTIIENQQVLIAQQAKLQTSLDSLVTLLSTQFSIQNKQAKITPNEIQDMSEFSPINSIDKLQEFEEQLKNDVYLNEVVRNMSYICGKSGKENGIDVCYKLIDYFLERNFVNQCSWTGNSKNENTSKIALKYYSNFRKCFLNTVLLADSAFSEHKCEMFLKRIIKNSSQRAKAKKILSTHKSRPKKMDYSKNKSKGVGSGSSKAQVNSDKEKDVGENPDNDQQLEDQEKNDSTDSDQENNYNDNSEMI